MKDDRGSSAYSFDPLFLLGNTKLSTWNKFDVYMVIPVVGFTDDTAKSKENHGGAHWKQEMLQHVHDILFKALGDRIRLIRVIWEDRQSNCWGFMNKKESSKRNIVIGLLLEHSTFSRVLDRGPNADDTVAASAFREFWGEKSELRRFKDGSIVEAVLWQNKYSNRYYVITQIVRYVLLRHLRYAINEKQIKRMRVSSNQLNQYLEPVFRTEMTANDLFRRFRQSLDSLALKITGMDSLPLRVTALQVSSSAGRYTMEHPPTYHPLLGNVESGLNDCGFASSVIKPHEVMLSLEASGRWPDDLHAIGKVKTAFLCSLGALLRKANGIKSLVRQDALDVAYDGYAFRLRIICDREKELLKIASSKIPTIVAGRRKFVFDNRVMVGHSDASKRLRKLRMNTELKIVHTNFIHSLQMRFSTYGEVTRLAKHWLHSKMLSDILPEEVVELLIASLFVEPSCRPYEPPSSFVTGFLRFLELIASHEWGFEPLVVDIDDSVNPSDIVEIENAFELKSEQVEHNDDECLFYVVASYDRDSTWIPAWIENNTVPKVYFKRFVTLAKESLQLLRGKRILDAVEDALKAPLRNEYDAVIHLMAENIPCREYPLFIASDKNSKKAQAHK